MFSGLVFPAETEGSGVAMTASISGSAETAYSALLAVTLAYLEASTSLVGLHGWDEFGWPEWVPYAEGQLKSVMEDHQGRIQASLGTWPS
jgi:hypothetical protein